MGYLVRYERLDDGDETKFLQAIKIGMFLLAARTWIWIGQGYYWPSDHASEPLKRQAQKLYQICKGFAMLYPNGCESLIYLYRMVTISSSNCMEEIDKIYIYLI